MKTRSRAAPTPLASELSVAPFNAVSSSPPSPRESPITWAKFTKDLNDSASSRVLRSGSKHKESSAQEAIAQLIMPQPSSLLIVQQQMPPLQMKQSTSLLPSAFKVFIESDPVEMFRFAALLQAPLPAPPNLQVAIETYKSKGAITCAVFKHMSKGHDS